MVSTSSAPPSLFLPSLAGPFRSSFIPDGHSLQQMCPANYIPTLSIMPDPSDDAASPVTGTWDAPGRDSPSSDSRALSLALRSALVASKTSSRSYFLPVNTLKPSSPRKPYGTSYLLITSPNPPLSPAWFANQPNSLAAACDEYLQFSS
jgi:hypothetical protein